MIVIPQFRSDLSLRIVAETDADFAVLGAAAHLSQSHQTVCGSTLENSRTPEIVISWLAKPSRPSCQSERDSTVIARAIANADAPYDARTCEQYPWAAAARIAHLESVILELAGVLGERCK